MSIMRGVAVPAVWRLRWDLGLVKRQCRQGSSWEKPMAPLGSRLLTDPSRVMEHNMWDHVQWTTEQEEEARHKVQENAVQKAPEEKQEQYEKEASNFWNGFYKIHENRFFKDRNWLFTEFPELLGKEDSLADPEVTSDRNLKHIASATEIVGDHTVCQQASTDLCNAAEMQMTLNDSNTFPGSLATFRILEIGCGAGNTIFPILQTNNDPDVFVYGCDFSQSAVELVKSHQNYDASRCHAFVHDLCDETSTFPFPEESLDIVISIFVLSAIHPEKVQAAVTRLSRLLKPGGVFLFRDYGRYDMAQLRFKKGRCLADNFYARGDGTRVYFFTQEEVARLFSSAGMEEVQNLVDRRLQVNRGKQITMYRVWIQAKYRKPLR
ncbi:tRNA N(3)-cytidine methyltransferase METTL2-like isoform X1 [Petromyzon marinus]|uniref:tRNA N(3)-cytidine methyltransferase n=1 Tax=Petromyzon marinus TaxID=7757 RepID=A0AAJ7SZ86_PETMA|nr:tRNA N(3)-methylcytidine methyltransferase METTL2-like isoform X1 [Petromyzon marinus]XP_032807319.1 tRNA N(3)-methylcytidine methyltransferase METTL2-like isoform X1 [Petromyzon marinus]